MQQNSWLIVPFPLLSHSMSRRKENEETDKQTRIAIVSDDKCKPKRCRQECKKTCPVVRMGKLCIEVTPTSKIASLSEELCIGCGICVKVGHLRLSPSLPALWSNLSFAFPRNVPLRPSQLSTCPATWTSTQRIDTARTPSSCIVCPSRDPARCSAWWDRMVLASPRP